MISVGTPLLVHDELDDDAALDAVRFPADGGVDDAVLGGPRSRRSVAAGPSATSNTSGAFGFSRCISAARSLICRAISAMSRATSGSPTLRVVSATFSSVCPVFEGDRSGLVLRVRHADDLIAVRRVQPVAPVRPGRGADRRTDDLEAGADERGVGVGVRHEALDGGDARVAEHVGRAGSRRDEGEPGGEHEREGRRGCGRGSQKSGGGWGREGGSWRRCGI